MLLCVCLLVIDSSRYDKEEGVSDSKLAKRRPGRLHKWIGDTCLLLGSPKVGGLAFFLMSTAVFFSRGGLGGGGWGGVPDQIRGSVDAGAPVPYCMSCSLR